MSGPDGGRVWIHEGDNLEIIRTFEDASFTLVYLDPPFNTGRVQARQVESARSAGPDPVADATIRRGFHGREYERLRGDLRTFDDRFDDYWAFLEPRLLEAGACSLRTGRSTSTSTTARRTTRRCCSTRCSGGRAS